MEGWLAHGDLALEVDDDFLAVVEHPLIPARQGVSGPGFERRVWHLYGLHLAKNLLMLVMLVLVSSI